MVSSAEVLRQFDEDEGEVLRALATTRRPVPIATLTASIASSSSRTYAEALSMTRVALLSLSGQGLVARSDADDAKWKITITGRDKVRRLRVT
jgi:hypothetical protein